MLPIFVHAVVAAFAYAADLTPPYIADSGAPDTQGADAAQGPTHFPWSPGFYGPGLVSVSSCAMTGEATPTGETVSPCLALYCNAAPAESRVQIEMGGLTFPTPVKGRVVVDGVEVAALDFQTRSGFASYPQGATTAEQMRGIIAAMTAGQSVSLMVDSPAWQAAGLQSVPLAGFAEAVAPMVEACPDLASAEAGAAAAAEAAAAALPSVPGMADTKAEVTPETAQPWQFSHFGAGTMMLTCAGITETSGAGVRAAACVHLSCMPDQPDLTLEIKVVDGAYAAPKRATIERDGQPLRDLDFALENAISPWPLAHLSGDDAAALLAGLAGGDRLSIRLQDGALQMQGLLDQPMNGFDAALASFWPTCAKLPGSAPQTVAAPLPEAPLPEAPVVEVPEDPAPPPALAPSGPETRRDQARHGKVASAGGAEAPPMTAPETAPAPEPAPAPAPAPAPEPIPEPAAEPAPAHQPGGPLTVAADPAAPEATPQRDPARFITLEAAALPDQTGTQLAEVLMAARIPEVAAEIGAVPEVRGDLVLLNSGKLILIGNFCPPGQTDPAACGRAIMTTPGGGEPFTGGSYAMFGTGQIWIDLARGNEGFPDLAVMGGDGVAGKLVYVPGEGY